MEIRINSEGIEQVIIETADGFAVMDKTYYEALEAAKENGTTLNGGN
jgi:hypothetical protein